MSPLLIHAAKDYSSISEAYETAGGEEFVTKRLQLREEYCHLSGPLTEEQINAIKDAFPPGPVQAEIKARMEEWNNKLRDGLITPISEEQISVEKFGEDVKALYSEYSELLNGEAYSHFTEVKELTRKLFIEAYQSGVSPETVEAALREAELPESFIGRAVKEWRWKATSIPGKLENSTMIQGKI